MEIVPVYTSVSNICEWPWQHNYRTFWSSFKKKSSWWCFDLNLSWEKLNVFYLLKSHIDFLFCVFLCIIFVYLWGRVVSLLFVLVTGATYTLEKLDLRMWWISDVVFTVCLLILLLEYFFHVEVYFNVVKFISVYHYDFWFLWHI